MPGMSLYSISLLFCAASTLIYCQHAEADLQPPLDTVSISGQFNVEHVANQLQPSIEEQRRRLDKTYSWGAKKIYSYTHATSTHTLGHLKVLIMRYKQSSSSCSNCDTVISDEDLNYILDAGKQFISENSYGKAALTQIVVVPGTLSISTDGNFFTDIDACREAAYALGYDYSNFDFDLVWRAANDGPTGGSAVPGGRSQLFKYGGPDDRDIFARKIFPHEFTHNFGVGHAWQSVNEYGDNYDMVGGGLGHVSVAAKHRFSWITDAEIAMLDKSQSTTKTFTIHAFDHVNANVQDDSNSFLGVRVETQFMNAPCPVGKYQWCPDWKTSNSQNAWVDNQYAAPRSHYLWVSYRGHDGSAEPKLGASIHISKRSAEGWIDATNFIDCRPQTSSQKDAFLKEGETFVFDGHSTTSIVIKTTHVDIANKKITVEVSYINGLLAASQWESTMSSWLCTATVSCGRAIPVKLDMDLRENVVRHDGKSIALIKVGELHENTLQLRLCSDSTLKTSLTTYMYDQFPIGPVLHDSSLDIGAVSLIPDLCGAGNGGDGGSSSSFPPVVVFEGTGLDWVDGVELHMIDQQFMYYGTNGKSVMRNGIYPRYVGVLATTSWNLHLLMVHCDIHYCKKTQYNSWAGGDALEGWQWVISLGVEPGSGTAPQYEYFGSVDNARKTVTNPTTFKDNGVIFRKANNGFLATKTLTYRGPTTPSSILTTLGGHGIGAKWIILATTEKTKASILISLTQCVISSCAEGYQKSTGAKATALEAGCSTTCSSCPSGKSSLTGFTRCFWDAPSLQVTVDGVPSKTGVYKKVVGVTHRGLPYYRCTEGDCANHQGGGVTLRSDQFNGWVLSVLTNMNDGSGYGGDGRVPNQCNCQTKTPVPQLWDASPCPNCAGQDSWTFSGVGKKVSIEEIGTPPDDTRISDSPSGSGGGTCSCADDQAHSLSGVSVYCIAGSENVPLCTWKADSDSSTGDDSTDDSSTDGDDSSSIDVTNSDNAGTAGTAGAAGAAGTAGTADPISTPSDDHEEASPDISGILVGIIVSVLLVSGLFGGAVMYRRQKLAKSSRSTGAGAASKNMPAVATTTTTQPVVVIEMSGETMTMDSNPMRTKRRSTLPPPLPARRPRGGSGSGRMERKEKKDTSLSSLEAI